MRVMGITEYITRWRHTRGYGVHSPLAYRIVKDCLYPDWAYGFYCDAYIDYEFRNEPRKGKHARKLIRLINLLKPKRVWIPDCDKRVRKALSFSFPRMQLTTNKECPKTVDMIVDFNGGDIDKLWDKLEGMEECTLVAFSKKAGRMDKMEKGPTLILEGGDYSILLRRKGMDFIRYKLI